MSGYPIAVVAIAAGGATWLVVYGVLWALRMRAFSKSRVPKATARRRRP